jgi:hypothetical protein
MKEHMIIMTNTVDAFKLKKGPTESGVPSNHVFNGIPSDAVGGELLPFNLIESLSIQVILIMILLIPAFLLLYKKRDYAVNLIARIFF